MSPFLSIVNTFEYQQFIEINQETRTRPHIHTFWVHPFVSMVIHDFVLSIFHFVSLATHTYWKVTTTAILLSFRPPTSPNIQSPVPLEPFVCISVHLSPHPMQGSCHHFFVITLVDVVCIFFCCFYRFSHVIFSSKFFSSYFWPNEGATHREVIRRIEEKKNSFVTRRDSEIIVLYWTRHTSKLRSLDIRVRFA